ncbi:glycosyl transferase family 1 [Roseiarcus fermentans]|uniref:Glycosyl transferase family 1 n=2 Tax=Roseiarcus fermentans TaxID=1473586 RepID=A0A366FPK3_9HYPH|nr:glycosyl transferase family 1 [Roseiarcus fermentans]
MRQLGLLSGSLLDRGSNLTTLEDPLFDNMSERANVRTIRPPAFVRHRFREWLAVRSQVSECDTLLWMQKSTRPSPPIHLAALSKPSARRSAFVIDPWKYSVSRVGYSSLIHRFDPCFIPYSEAFLDLKRAFSSARFSYMPYAADTSTFFPRSEDKSIFAFWMGRRDEPLHRALLRYCSERNLEYVYSNEGRYSRDSLGCLASSARYFVVTPPQPERSGGYSPIVMRYFEGLAAGARLLGVLPKSGEYERMLPLNAICQVAPDGSDLAQRLDEDRENSENQTIVKLACALVHRHHSLRRRAEQIYDRLERNVEIDIPLPDVALSELVQEQPRPAGRRVSWVDGSRPSTPTAARGRVAAGGAARPEQAAREARSP